MSSIFTQITQEAQKQREQIEKQSEAAQPVASSAPTAGRSTADSPELPSATESSGTLTQQNATPPSDTTVPHSGTTITKDNGSVGTVAGKTRRAEKTSPRGEGMVESNRLDLEKLKTIIEELSVMPASSNGLNVRMSAQEMQDIDDFIHDTLRKEGLKGYQVSIAKLMRYAMRYMFRVHPHEFVTALRAALEVEETLSI